MLMGAQFRVFGFAVASGVIDCNPREDMTRQSNSGALRQHESFILCHTYVGNLLKLIFLNLFSNELMKLGSRHEVEGPESVIK